jgi:PTH1 family peptidyl-tRNA hydrolase
MGSFTGWIVAGLGNPGTRYAGTRHDLGFMLADRLARELSVSWRKERGAEVAGPARLPGADEPLLLVKPIEYMNLSGPPLQSLLGREHVPPSRLLVACDDINLPLGRLRLRPSGSAGGHNGLSSIIGCIGTEFPRLRLGVGKEPPGVDRADWVLSRFKPEEKAAVERMLEGAETVVRILLKAGFDAAVRAVPPG